MSQRRRRANTCWGSPRTFPRCERRAATSGGDALPSFDPRDFRNALGAFATGVTIVTTNGSDGTPIGLTCNSFNSVSLSPALVLWSLSLRSPNLNRFLQAPHFAVNVLAEDQRAISQRFAQPIANKFEGVRYTQGKLGLPLIFDAAAHLECRNETRYYSGDHVISSATCSTTRIATARRWCSAWMLFVRRKVKTYFAPEARRFASQSENLLCAGTANLN